MNGVEILVVFCFCTVIATASTSNNGTAAMKHQLKQLEETVTDLQKHMVTQEEEQRALLSSLLSRLITTSTKLDKLQNNYKALENELSSLKENYTAVDGAGKGVIGQEVAFEASMAKDNHLIKFLTNSTLKFPTIQYNKGGCWNASNGMFTASVNGTYLFWIDLTFTGTTAFILSMKRNDEDFGKAFARLPNPRETSMISRISITELLEGDRVHFVSNKNVNYFPSASSCGGVLLHSDVH